MTSLMTANCLIDDVDVAHIYLTVTGQHQTITFWAIRTNVPSNFLRFFEDLKKRPSPKIEWRFCPNSLLCELLLYFMLNNNMSVRSKFMRVRSL